MTYTNRLPLPFNTQHINYGLLMSKLFDGDADAAVEARIRIGWNKFRQLLPLLTNRDISLIRRGRLYTLKIQRVI